MKIFVFPQENARLVLGQGLQGGFGRDTQDHANKATQKRFAPLWVSLGLSWLPWASLGFSGPRLASLASVVSSVFLLHFSNAFPGFSKASPVTFLGPMERAARSRAERGSAQRIKLRCA